MSDLFKEWIPSFFDKNYMYGEHTEDEYKKLPFIINRALSYYKELIFHANEINVHHSIDPKLHYDYLFYSIPKKKRKTEYMASKGNHEALPSIMQYYSCSQRKAREFLRFLKEDQVKFIVDFCDVGGKVAKGSK